MKILVDSVGTKHSGGARVLADVVSAALENDKIGEIVLLASPERFRRFSLPQNSRLRVIDIEGVESAHGRIMWAFWGLHKMAVRQGCDAFLGLNGICPRGCKCARAVLVQQSLPFCPDAIKLYGLSGRLRIRAIKEVTRLGVSRADAVYVQTSVMQDNIVKAFKTPKDKIHVFFPNAPTFADAGISERDVFKRTPTSEFSVLYVGNDSPYKNIKVVADGIGLLDGVKASLYATLEPGNPLCASGCLTPVGRLDDDELPAAYMAADVLVMPSLTETVGLPMLEAMKAGTAVLAADLPYAHAVCGDAALFFDPNSPRDFADKLTKLIKDTDLRAGLVEKGRILLLNRDKAKSYAAMIEQLISLTMTAR
jgi:glycosyltransferase involved in cell wall biosynthesis